MLALVLAMISLAPDPDPLATPSAALHDRLTQATGFGSDPKLASGVTSGIAVSVCTYGTPAFGTGLVNAAGDLARTFTEPACSSYGTGFGTGSTGFSSGSPFGLGSPWLPAASGGFVQLDPAGLRPAAMPAFAPALPVRFTAPAPVFRTPSSPVLRARPADPVTVRPRSVSGTAPQRTH